MFNLADFHNSRRGEFGKDLYYFDQLESTNLTAETLAKNRYPEGTVVLANSQTHGRGRKGNAWYSPPDVNLYFSVVLRPQFDSVRYLPFFIALSVLNACEELQLPSDLKWPNDILINGKKTCGFLVQTAVEGQSLQYAIAGCGINVNLMEIPAGLKGSVTSIALEKGSPVAREPLLASILFHFGKLYEQIPTIHWDDFCSDLEKRSTFLRGCDVQVHQDGQTYTGITSGLDSYGGLLLKTGNGVKVFYAGEIEACRKK
jgi:BirA family biotin operon repressor/biotin-[acetyl-CoA-carboxylase] ligase